MWFISLQILFWVLSLTLTETVSTCIITAIIKYARMVRYGVCIILLVAVNLQKHLSESPEGKRAHSVVSTWTKEGNKSILYRGSESPSLLAVLNKANAYAVLTLWPGWSIINPPPFVIIRRDVVEAGMLRSVVKQRLQINNFRLNQRVKYCYPAQRYYLCL